MNIAVPYTLSVDHTTRTVIIACRSTLSWRDTVVDALIGGFWWFRTGYATCILAYICMPDLIP